MAGIRLPEIPTLLEDSDTALTTPTRRLSSGGIDLGAIGDPDYSSALSQSEETGVDFDNDPTGRGVVPEDLNFQRVTDPGQMRNTTAATRIARSKTTGKKFVEVGGAWKEAIVARSKTTGERLFSVDGGKSWRPVVNDVSRDAAPGAGRSTAQVAGDALKRGVEQAKMMGYGLAGVGLDMLSSDTPEPSGADRAAAAFGIDLDTAAHAAMKRAGEVSQKIAREYPPEIADYREIDRDGGILDTFGRLQTYVTEAILENAPSLGISILTGGLGGAIAKKIGERAAAQAVRDALERGLTMQAAEALAMKAANRYIAGGAFAGALAGSAPQEIGSISADIYEGTGKIASDTSILYGVAAGMLDAIPAGRAASQVLKQKAAEVAVEGIIRRYGKEAATQFIAEAPTEYFQTILEVTARGIEDPNFNPYTDEVTAQAIDAFLKGGLAGAATGVGVQGVSDASDKLAGRKPAPKVKDGGPTDLLQPGDDEDALPTDDLGMGEEPGAPPAAGGAPAAGLNLPDDEPYGPYAEDDLTAQRDAIDVGDVAPDEEIVLDTTPEEPAGPYAEAADEAEAENQQMMLEGIDVGDLSPEEFRRAVRERAMEPASAEGIEVRQLGAPESIEIEDLPDAQPGEPAQPTEGQADEGQAETAQAEGEKAELQDVTPAAAPGATAVPGVTRATESVPDVAAKGPVRAIDVIENERRALLGELDKAKAAKQRKPIADRLDALEKEHRAAMDAAGIEYGGPGDFKHTKFGTEHGSFDFETPAGRVTVTPSQAVREYGYENIYGKKGGMMNFALHGPGVDSETGYRSISGVPYEGEMTMDKLRAAAEELATKHARKAPEKPSMGKIVHKASNDQDGVDVQVVRNAKGYAVTVKDRESGKTLPSAKIFPEERMQEAIDYADSVAAGKPKAAKPEKPVVDRAQQARERQKKRDRVDPNTDSLAVAIAKIGGLSPEAAAEAGMDLAGKNSMRVPQGLGYRGIKYLVHKNGADWDTIRERLTELGYYPDGEDYNRLMDMLDDEIRSRAPKHFSAQATDLSALLPEPPVEEANDNGDQIPWLNLQAREAGYADAEDMFIQNPDLFARMAEQWRSENLSDAERDSYDGLVADLRETIGPDGSEELLERVAAQLSDLDEAPYIRRATVILKETIDAEKARAQAGDNKGARGAAPQEPEEGGDRGGEPDRAGAESPLLESYSAEELAAREKAREEDERAQAEEERKAAEKEAADRAREDFTLTGSDRDADVAAAAGQADLLSAPAETPPEEPPEPPKPSGGGGPRKRGADYGSKNKLVTTAEADDIRNRLKKKIGRLNAGIDPETLLDGTKLAVYHLEAGVRGFGDWARAMLEDVGEEIKPYLRMWYEAARYYPGVDNTGMTPPDQIPADIDAAIGATDDQRSSGDLERDRGDATPADEVGAEDVSTEPGGADAGGREPVRGPARSGGSGRRGDRVSGGAAAPAGERGDLPLFDEAGPAGSEDGAAGGNIGERGGDGGIEGTPIESVADDAVKASAAGFRDAGDKRERQRLAQDVAVKLADPANIDDSLPFLLDGQREDVAFAERRYSKPAGYGALFTNGTGTGKTYTGLGIAKRFERRGKRNILVIVPSDKIAHDWIASAKNLLLDGKMLPHTKSNGGGGLIVTTYANLGQNPMLADVDWDLVIADEAHNLSSNKDGESTDALTAFRAITLHPDGAWYRAQMIHRDEYEELLAAQDAHNRYKKLPDEQKDPAKLAELSSRLEHASAKWRELLDEVRADVGARQGEARTRALLLSATPFAYEKSVDWASGYLFEYSKEQASGYNAPNGYQRFMIEHFGYRMRYGKLTEPEAGVNRGLMQRNFNGWLKREGVLSGRMLDVPFDYDRKFVAVESQIGTRIDRVLELLRENRRYWKLYEYVRKQFDHLSRRQLLEALKAREVVPLINDHIALGRKVVVFHDFNVGGSFNPFDFTKLYGIDEQVSTGDGFAKLGDIAKEFDEAHPEAGQLGEEMIGLPPPIEALKQAFPDALFFNGTVPKAQRRRNMEKFNADPNAKLIIVQADAGGAGVSLHDTTGEHPRVLFNLGLPTKPTTAIQQEGRIYRTGQASNAMFRYMNTGTTWERIAFAQTIATRSSAVENMALGESARALMDGFIQAFEDAAPYPAGHEGEGTGGKERDVAANAALSEFDRAVAMYYANQRKNSRTKSAEGEDYYPTPEPLGLKMVEWADIKGNESVLEPSAGHGAIARWIPETVQKTAIEPSEALASRLALGFHGKIIRNTFENHHVVNKYDAIVMNPPFGTGGKTAIDHVAKAVEHMNDGGRIVALIPRGPAADKRLDAFLYETKTRPTRVLAETRDGKQIRVGDTADTQYHKGMKVLGLDRSGNVRLKNGEGRGSWESSYPLNQILEIRSTGPKTEEYSESQDMYLVANIELPNVTFERAGTKVATRIIVLEKQTDPNRAAAIPQRNRSIEAESINELFDSIKDMTLPGRKEAAPAAQPESAPAQQPQPAQAAGAQPEQAAQQPAAPAPRIPQKGRPIISHTTQAGKVIRGIVVEDMSRADVEKVDPYTFKKGAGFFVREKHVIKDGPDGQTGMLQIQQAPAMRASDQAQADAFRQDGARVTDAAGQPIAVRDTGMMQMAGPLWYSELAKQVEALKLTSASPQQWKATILGLTNKGVKKDEIHWSGVLDAIDMAGGAFPIKKDDVVNYLRNNGVRVEEKILGEKEAQDISYSESDWQESEPDDEWIRDEARNMYLDDAIRDIAEEQEIDESDVDEDEAMEKAVEMMRDAYHSDPADREHYMTAELTVGDRTWEFTAYSDGNIVDMGSGESIADLRHPTREGAVETEIRGYVARQLGLDAADLDGDTLVPEDGAKYDEHTLPGGENYRELLLTLPPNKRQAVDLDIGNRNVQDLTPEEREAYFNFQPEERAFQYSHFDEPNILAHVRFNERTDADGRRVLFIEEIQSDWAQKGKREGFSNKPATAPAGWASTGDARGTGAGIPSAPFVTKTEAWVSLALKRMIRYAADNGFDRVAWTTGEQQADRYDLSKQVDAVLYTKSKGGMLLVKRKESRDRGAWEEIASGIPEDRLDDHIGKDAADKIRAMQFSDHGGVQGKELRGMDLKVGGEGMRAFYDKIVPNVAKDVLRKIGGGQLVTVDIGPVNRGGEPRYNYVDWRRQPNPNYMAERVQQGFDITEAMREKAAAGMPLFQVAKGGKQAQTLPELDEGLLQDDADNERLEQWRQAIRSATGQDPGAIVAANLRDRPTGSLVDAIADLLGIRVVVFQGRGLPINGVFFRNEDRTVYINADIDRPHLRVLGHEFLHLLRDQQPELYRDFIRAVIDQVDAKQAGAYAAGLNANRKAVGMSPLSPDTLQEEIVAEFFGDQFAEPEFWRRVAANSPTAAARVVRFLRNFLSQIIDALKGRANLNHQVFKDVIAAREAAARAVAQFVEAGVRQRAAEGSAAIRLPEAMQLSPAENIGDRIAKALQNIESRVPLYLGRTPGLLRKLGLPDLPMGIPDKNLRKVVDKHPDVPQDVLRAIADAIADPVAVYRDRSPSATHGTLRVVLEHHASDGRPIFVSVRPDSTLAQVRANEVPTIFAPELDQIAGKMLNSDLLYVNNKKAPAFMRKVPATSVPGAALRPAPGRSVLTDRGVGKALRTAELGADPWAQDAGMMQVRPPTPAQVAAVNGAAGKVAGAIAPAAKQLPSLKQRAASVLNWIEDVLEPLHGLQNRDDYLDKRNLALGAVARSQELARKVYDIFKGASEADSTAILEYLTDRDASASAITDQKQRDTAKAVKMQIENIGKALVDRGIIPKESFEHYQGRYLPRLYLAYLLGDRAISAVASGKKPGEMGYRKKRDESLPQEYRDIVLGEIKDPAFLAAKAIGLPMRDIAILDWFDQIAASTDWALPKQFVLWTMPGFKKPRRVTPYWLKSEAQKLRQRAVYYQDSAIKAQAMALASSMDVAADAALQEAGLTGEAVPEGYKKIPDAPRYGALRGMVVREQIYSDIVGTARVMNDDASMFERVLAGDIGQRVTSEWKFLKVAANPPAQVRNFVSNMVLLNLSGVPFHRIPGLLRRAFGEVRNRKGRYYQIARDFGLTESTFSSVEMHRIDRELRDYQKRTQDGFSPWRLFDLYAIFRDWASDRYQDVEAIGKLMKVMDEVERNGADIPAAVREAQKWLFDYSLVQPSVRYLRNAPIGAPFLTFSIKVLPRLLEVALHHPLRLLPYAGLMFGMQMAAAAMLDVGYDDIDKLKKALPEFLQKRGHVMFIPFKDENGNWQFVDVGYFFPWSQWYEFGRGIYGSAEAVIKGDTPGLNELIGVTGLLGGPLPDLLTAIKSGKDPFTGREIADARDPASTQYMAWITYLWNMAMPSFMAGMPPFHEQALYKGAIGHMYEALSGYVDKRTGEPKSTVPQAALRALGVNVYPIDPKQSRENNLYWKKREIEDVKRRMKQRLKDRNNDAEDKKEIRRDYGAKIKRMEREMREYRKDTQLPRELL